MTVSDGEGSLARTGQPIAQTIGATKTYPGVTALDGVDFEVRVGEVRALLGQNGAGKSTLIRLLSGVETATSGQVLIDGSPLGADAIRDATERGVATCYQELSVVPQLTVAENFFLGHWLRGSFGIDLRAMAQQARETLSSLGADIDPLATTSTLTLAQQQIVEIARALRRNPKLLILDEPTSALATAEVSLVLETVRRVSSQGVAVLYVSHRMDEIRQIADTATIMRNGKVIETVSIAQADTRTIIALMLGSETDHLASIAEPADAGETLLEAVDLAVPPKLTSVSLKVRAGEVLGIAGLLGSGRTELLRALAGFDPIASGSIRVRGAQVPRPTAAHMRALGIGMTPEDRKREGAFMNLGIDENIVVSDYPRVSRSGVLQAPKIRSATTTLAEKLSIKAHDLSQLISTLSGGNQQKAVIGRWLFADADVLLFDEPTRGVDVEAKAQIYAIMRQVAASGKAVVFVSSELEELPLACDRVLVLRDGLVRTEMSAPDISLNRLLEVAMASESPKEAR